MKFTTRITKEILLKGIEYTERVETPELGKDTYIVIRPLRDSEYSEMQTMLTGDLTFSESLESKKTMGEMAAVEKKARWEALSKASSINNQEFTPEMISMLQPSVTDRLFTRLCQISGIRMVRPLTDINPKERATLQTELPADLYEKICLYIGLPFRREENEEEQTSKKE